MLTGLEQTRAIWQQLYEEFDEGLVESIDESSGNLCIYVVGRKNRWVLIVAGDMRVSTMPELPEGVTVSPEFFVGLKVNRIFTAIENEVIPFDVDVENAFMSMDNINVEFYSPLLSVMAECHKLGFTKDE